MFFEKVTAERNEWQNSPNNIKTKLNKPKERFPSGAASLCAGVVKVSLERGVGTFMLVEITTKVSDRDYTVYTISMQRWCTSTVHYCLGGCQTWWEVYWAPPDKDRGWFIVRACRQRSDAQLSSTHTPQQLKIITNQHRGQTLHKMSQEQQVVNGVGEGPFHNTPHMVWGGCEGESSGRGISTSGLGLAGSGLGKGLGRSRKGL